MGVVPARRYDVEPQRTAADPASTAMSDPASMLPRGRPWNGPPIGADANTGGRPSLRI